LYNHQIKFNVIHKIIIYDIISLEYFCQVSYKTRNNTGPGPLPWTTPLCKPIAVDSDQPTLVWWVWFAKQFWIHSNTSPQMPYEYKRANEKQYQKHG